MKVSTVIFRKVKLHVILPLFLPTELVAGAFPLFTFSPFPEPKISNLELRPNPIRFAGLYCTLLYCTVARS